MWIAYTETLDIQYGIDDQQALLHTGIFYLSFEKLIGFVPAIPKMWLVVTLDFSSVAAHFSFPSHGDIITPNEDIFWQRFGKTTFWILPFEVTRPIIGDH